jgi:TrmH family RNA methyltransferase
MSQQSWAGVVEDVRRALAPRGRAQLGQFAVEGKRLLERAVRSGHPPRRVVISDRLLRQSDPKLRTLLNDLEAARCTVWPVPEAVMVELAEGRNGGLLIGLCDTPKAPSVADLRLRAMGGGGPVLVLVDIEEPGNVGALVRTALASGASGCIAVGTSDPYHPKAVRTSMGSLFKLPILRAQEPGDLLNELQPLKRYAAVASYGLPPWQLQISGPMALFVGNEADGLQQELVSSLDGTLSIPMPNGVDSFSVNAAAAILLYEYTRQAAKQKGTDSMPASSDGPAS